MAKRNSPPPLVDDSLLDMPTTAEEEDFFTFLDDVGPSVSTVDVYRRHPNGKLGYIERITFDVLRENAMDFLRDTYGPGKYVLQFKGADRKVRASKTVEIDPKVNGAAPTAAPGAVSPAADHLQFMREQMATQQNLLMTMIASMKPPDLTPIATAMLTASSQNKGTDPAAMLTAVVAAFTALRGPAKDEDWLQRAKTIIEMAKDLAPDGEKNDSWVSVARDVGKEVLLRLPAPGAAPAAPEAPPIRPEAPRPAELPNEALQPARAAENPPQGQDENERNYLAWLRAGIEYLKEKAVRGKDTELVLDWIFENQEEPQFSAILEAIKRGATMEHLLQFDPTIADNPATKTFFREIYEGIQNELRKPVDTPGAGGHADNTAEDARGSAQGPERAGNSTTGKAVSNAPTV